MPFTQVTLVNGSDKPATAHIHVNEEVGAEGWIKITAAKGETKVAVTEAQEPLVKIYATHPHVGHNSTRVIRGKKEINMTEPVHVPGKQITAINVLLGPSGAGVLNAHILDPFAATVFVQSRPLA